MTPEQQALLRQRLAQKGVIIAPRADDGPGARPAGEEAPLSFAQERLWFVQQLQPENTAYHLGQVFTVKGPLVVAALERAMAALVARHESLRSAFPERGGRGGCAVAAPAATGPLVYTDCAALPAAARDAAVAAHEHAVLAEPFDLAQPTLLRARLLRLAPENFRLLVCVHHLVFDGWSIGVFVRELGALYAAFAAGASASPLPASPLSYGDYAAWQRRRAGGPAWAASLAFWQTRLAGTPVLALPTDHRRPAALSGRGAGHRFTVPAAGVAGVRALGLAERATPFMVFLAAWQTVLGRYSGQTDFAVGSPVANRAHAALENMVGFFVNMIALRAELAGDPSFRTVLRQVNAQVQVALSHQETPFEQIVERLNIPRDLSHHPVFQVGFTLQNAPVEPVRLAGVEFAPVEPEIAAAKFDLLLALEDAPDGAMRGTLEYSTDLFAASTMELLAENFLTLLAGATSAPDTTLSRLPLVSAAERALWPAPAAPRPEPPGCATLVEWFGTSAARHAERTAVTDGTVTLTYAELDARSDRLANFLVGHGAGPDRLVAVAMERSAHVLVALLGILKAGAAYLPIDPAYPAERQEFMLRDGAAVVLLTDAARRAAVTTPAGVPVFCLDRDWPEISAAAPVSRPGNEPEHTAYVIYTSGSTGRPKGVPVTHRNVTRLFTQTDHWFGFGPADVWTLFHSFAFDFSVWEIWGALLYGGRLVVVPFAVSRAVDRFHDLLAREGVTVLSQTPSAFRQLVNHDTALPSVRPLALRWVVFGGEALDLPVLAPWFARRGDRTPRLVNMYGITETTVHVTYREITAADVAAGTGSVIGEPIPDLTLHLLDAHLAPVPRGVAGEIFVGGAGLARGYLNRPELTAERFIAHPFAATTGGRLYRSGDSARRLANGDVEYLGRIDFQVKVRGFRIELGEIESALGAHPAIAEAAVIALRAADGATRLAAWLVARDGAEPGIEVLRRHLLASLPDYMVPAAFTFVAQLPLTTNGKVDRAALPALTGRRAEAVAERIAPETEPERLLAAVWQKVLGVPAVGVTENFFALGGDSIRSIEVRAAVRARGYDFQLQELFRHQSVRELAAVLVPLAETAAAVPGAFALIAAADRARLPADVVDAYPLAALQAGMVFHSELNPASPVFHDLFSYHLRASWDEAALRAALAAAVRRHPILRTSVRTAGFGEPLQCVHAHAVVPLDVADITALDSAAQEAVLDAWSVAEKARGFAWSEPPLMRAAVHRRSATTWQFSLSLHHAILDGWSVSALLAEIFTAYLETLAGRTPPVAASAPAPFRDYVALERATVASEESRAFWAVQLDDPPAAQLPRVPARAGATEAGQDAVFVTWPRERTTALEGFAARAGVSLKHALLAAHAKVVAHLAGTREVITGVISNGRPETAGSAESLGLFLNTVPYRLAVAPGTWSDLARAVLRSDEAVLPHRRFPLAELQRNRGRAALFETSFNFVRFRVLDALRARGDIAVLGTRYFDQNTFAYFAQFSADSAEGTLQLELRYDPAEFTREQAVAFAATYERVLAAMTGASETRHETLELLGTEERRRVVETFNSPPLPPGAPRLLHDGLAENVKRAPDAIALIDGEVQLTYGELAASVGTWARRLRALGAGPEKLVGVCLERSADLVTALLAVLETGAAYVPLDPAYPADRLAFMCEDAQVAILVSRRELAARLPAGGWTLLDPAELRALPPAATGETAVTAGARPENLAYLIYTSGSTGRPKATAIEHRQATALIAWARAHYTDAQLAGVLFSTSVCFDLSIFELFVTLAAGGKIIVAENALALPTLPARAAVTLVNTVPSAAAELVRQRALPPGVRTVNLAGEPLSATLADQIHAFGTVEKLHDLYGPSEDTTYSTCAERRPGGAETIGHVLPGSQLYLLDEDFQPVPLGTVGEIFLGGAGLARGYLGRPDLTAERFLPNPFATQPGARLYRTGDLGRFRADGQVEFLGRRDHQVKIRGFRIELGEIKAVLEKHPAIAAAAVVAREDVPGVKRLVAYVAGPALPTGRALDGELRAWLGARLPEYFVPAAFVPLAALPLTPNGKLDRRALPAPAEAVAAADDYTAPRTAEETALARIWAEVLRVPRVGVHDNYFSLGGDSIQVLQLVALAREAGLGLTPRLIFEQPTVAQLALAATATTAAVPAAAAEEEPGAAWALTPIQRWFFAQGFTEEHHWNQSVLLTAREPLDAAKLASALRAVTARHPLLRARFTAESGGARVLRIAEPSAGDVAFRVVPFATAAEITAACAAEQGALDLAHGPLVRALWLDGGATQPGRLFIVIHHLVIDGVSWRIVLDDLLAAYRGAAALPPATASSARWARWLGTFLWAEEAAHWQALAAAPAVRLPRDLDGTENRAGDAAICAVTLTPTETEGLLRRALSAYSCQINDLLLAALALALREWTRAEAITLHLEGHGRETAETGIELGRTVGWFTTLFPVRLDLSGVATAPAAVTAVRTQLAAVPRRGLGYGAGRWLAQPPRWDVPAAELCFNYLGQFDGWVGGDSPFGPAEESVGPQTSPRGERAHLIDVNGLIVGGALKFEWHYGTRLHRRETIARLADAHFAHLRTLIAAAGTTAAEPTTERFALAGATDAELDQAIGEIEF